MRGRPYFSFVTRLTIGYGEIIVKTFPCRIVAVLIGLIGIVFTDMVVAIAVRALQKTFEESQ